MMRRRDMLKVLPALVLGRFVTACVVEERPAVPPRARAGDVPDAPDACAAGDVSTWVPVELAAHPQLSSPGGWTSIEVPERFVHVNVVALEGGCFLAAWAICTHGACPLEAQPEQERFWCSCHGSAFDYDGAVMGGPATEDLRILGAVRLGETLWIEPPFVL
ncbi:MAG: Rieske 2Fe-2S domain-containing protein [Myxococcota bacterium]